MAYSESNIDRRLRTWFKKDNTKGLLKSICVEKGPIRGLTDHTINFSFPITAIAGKNGCGKSTLLALACCGFHNHKNGFKLTRRKYPYYTFADFFVFHSEDNAQAEILIKYQILHNRWKKSEYFPNGEGLGYQVRKKSNGGRWNNYASRVKRDVVFLGIERIVPHIEKSQSKNYSRSFAYCAEEGWEDEVKSIVGYILGRSYTEFRFTEHSVYRLPIVKSGGYQYSGFNMGAGENALFEMFSVMHAVHEGALIVIDEIELGLHSHAQVKFMEKLKDVCFKRKLQVICTTHSKEIFASLPDDARIFLERTNGKTNVLQSISPEFAFSKLSLENSGELSVLVEDTVSKAILTSVLPSSIRSRITIEVIGSATSLARQLAASYIRSNEEIVFAIFDGDQRASEDSNVDHACKMSETSSKDDFKEWAKSHIAYLPGETWPESWLVSRALEQIDILSTYIGTESDELRDVLESGLQAGKHNEFNEIGKLVGLSEAEVVSRICLSINQSHADAFQPLIENINIMLGEWTF